MNTFTLSETPMPFVLLLAGLSILPFLLTVTTSFIKYSIVLSLLRHALGTQQTPPNHVLVALSIILSSFVMAPTASKILYNLEHELGDSAVVSPEGKVSKKELQPKALKTYFEMADRIADPLREFLTKHADVKEVKNLVQLSHRMQKNETVNSASMTKDSKNFINLIPAFAITQLKEAFIIGFLIFLPFILIDMITANVLLSLGMHMLSPTTISLPLKILLFVLADGWSLLLNGITESYL